METVHQLIRQKKNIAPLITSRNNPKVNNVIGKVNNTRTGLTRTLISPSTSATSMAVPKTGHLHRRKQVSQYQQCRCVG